MSHLLQLPAPKRYDLNFLRSWLIRPSMGNFPLLGPDSTSWSSPHGYDLFAMHRRSSSDPFTHFFLNILLPFAYRHTPLRIFRRPIPEDPEAGIYKYDDQSARTFVDALGTVMASLLPVSSIVVLYFIQA